jgi:GGDEF domain-containing protein
LAICSIPYQLEEYHYRSTSSIGATLFNDHQQKPDVILIQADQDMYQAKNAGRNTLCFFELQER